MFMQMLEQKTKTLYMDKISFLETHISVFSVLLDWTNDNTIQRHTSCGNADVSSMKMNQDKSLQKPNIPLKWKPFVGSLAKLIPVVWWRSGLELADAQASLWLPGCERRGLLQVRQLHDWTSGHRLRLHFSSESQILCQGHGRILKEVWGY